MGCNFSCIDPGYFNSELEVRIGDKAFSFKKRPKSLSLLYESLLIDSKDNVSNNTVFEFSGNDGIIQLTNDLLLHEAYILNANKKLVIGARNSCNNTLK